MVDKIENPTPEQLKSSDILIARIMKAVEEICADEREKGNSVFDMVAMVEGLTKLLCATLAGLNDENDRRSITTACIISITSAALGKDIAAQVIKMATNMDKTTEH